MLVLGVLSLIIGTNAVRLTADTATVRAATPDSAIVAPWQTRIPGDTSRDVRGVAPRFLATLSDTPRVRRKVVELSDWYSRRLTIHRYVSYATLPVFALQYAAGDQLFKKGAGAPTWAKTMHRAGATTLAGMFTVNTVTGAWNWWDSRSASQGRTLRTVHALSILVADGMFTYAGAKLSNEAETSASKRAEHRKIALSAMGLTIVSAGAMKLWNR
jgi:hypothetical protein